MIWQAGRQVVILGHSRYLIRYLKNKKKISLNTQFRVAETVTAYKIRQIMGNTEHTRTGKTQETRGKTGGTVVAIAVKGLLHQFYTF